MLTKEVVQKIKTDLGACSDRVVARYIGVTRKALIENLELPLDPKKRMDSRLMNLQFILDAAVNDGIADSANLHRLLTLPSLERDGWEIDLISAIHAGEEKEVLLEILKSSIIKLRKSLI